MAFSYFSKNGNLAPLRDATIPLEDIAYQYGFGVYETLKVRNSVLYFIDQHVARLLESARLLGLEHPFIFRDISSYIAAVVKKNAMENGNIKMLLIGGKTAQSASLYILPLAPLFPDRKLYTKGASAITVQYERFLPNAKTLNMLRSYLYYTQAIQRGHYDVVFVDKRGYVLEGSRTNFFAIKGRTVVTPPAKYVLEGVTRQTVIYAARKSGFRVVERRISKRSLKTYDSTFLTSTSSNIIPLVNIDAIRYPNIPPALKELMDVYKTYLKTCGGVFQK